MDITVQINIKGQTGELSIPEIGWRLRFADQYAGFVAVYRLCETNLLNMEAGGRFVRAVERSGLPKEWPAGIAIYEDSQLKMFASDLPK